MATTSIFQRRAPLGQTAVAPTIAQPLINLEDQRDQRIASSEYDPRELQKQLEASSPTDQPTVQSDFYTGDSLVPKPGSYGVEQAVPQINTVSDQNQAEETQVPVPIPQQFVGTDMDSADVRLATPTQLPNFEQKKYSYDTLMDAEKQVAQSFDELGYKKYEEERAGRSGFDVKRWTDLSADARGNEAIALTNHADAIKASIFGDLDKGEGPTGIFANEAVQDQFQADLGLTPELMATSGHTIASGVLLALSRTADDIRNRRYSDNVVKEDGVPDSESLTSDDPIDFAAKYEALKNKNEQAADPEKRKEDWLSAVADITHQPVLQGMINGIGRALGRLLSRPSTPTQMYAPKNVSALTSSALAYSFYEKGYIELGKDKYGRIYPYLTAKGEDFLNDTQRASAIYDPEQRHLNVNAPIIKSVSAPTRNLAYSNLQHMYTPDGRVIDGQYTLQERAALYTGSVGVSVHPVAYSILAQMRADVEAKMVSALPDSRGTIVPPNTLGAVPNAFSTSEFAKSMSDLSREKFIEKAAKLRSEGKKDVDIAAEISSINKNKSDQDNKHINEYLQDNISRGPRFDVVKLSEATQRMFGTARDINVVNMSGTIRPATAYGNKARFVPKFGEDLRGQINRAHATVNRVYSTKGAKGMAVGASIHRALMSLDLAERSMLGAMYHIAKVAEDLGYLHVPGNRASPDVYIKALTPQAFDAVAAFGKQAIGWSANGLPTESNKVLEMPPAFAKGGLPKLFTKKEWSPLITNAVMAHNISNAIRTGTAVELDGLIESDASQSNAFIISSLIGDPSVSALLGNDVGQGVFDELKSQFKDLRSKASSTIPEDIVATFTGKDDAGIIEALTSLFDTARSRLGDSFDKAYARGIVVAGLYGKEPSLMYEEVETMLTIFHGVASTELDDVITNTYNGSRQDMVADMAAMYSTSMRRHMKNLQGYQKLMSAIGAVKAAFDGTTLIQSFGRTKIDLGISTVVAHDDETNTVKGLFGIDDLIPLQGKSESNLSAPGDYGRGISDIDAMKQRVAEVNMSMDDLMDALTEHTTPGDKARKALPVTLIQSGDSYQMAIAITYANKDIKGLALNIKSVHDAGITDPMSTLLYINAYNNIAPYILVENSRNIFESLRKSMDEDWVNAMGKVKAAGYADIGMKGRYKSMSGYFDRLYMGLFFKGRAEKMGRTPTDGYDWKAESTRRSKAVLDYIQSLQDNEGNGWYPPTERYKYKRDHMRVTPAQFNLMSKVILEHAGLLIKGDDPLVLKSKADERYITSKTTLMNKFIANNREFGYDMANSESQIRNTK